MPGEIGQHVLIARDEMVLGDDHDRVAVLGEHLQATAGEFQAPLDGLIAIGHAAQGHHARLPARVLQFTPQEFGRVFLDHDLGLEIRSGAVAQELVRGPRVAIDAAVLAAAVGVERGVEADVRAVVVGEDRLRRVGQELRQRPRQFPARFRQRRIQGIAIGLVAQLGKAAVRVALGTSAARRKVHGGEF